MNVEWPLIGRERELRAFDEIAARSESMLIVGPSGVGKSGLLAEMGARQRAADQATLVVAGSQAAQGVALAPLLALIPGRADVESSPTELFRAMLAEVRRLGQPTVFVDDAHLLDDASAALIAATVSSTEATVVLAARSDELLPDALDALWRQGVTKRVDLPFLDEDAVVELIRAVLPGPVDPQIPRDVWRLSKGSPLFVHELVAASVESGSLHTQGGRWVLREGLAVSDGLAGLIQRRLLNVPRSQIELLRLLSVQPDIGARHLEAIGGADAIAELEERGLVVQSRSGRRIELRLGHPMYGEVLRRRGRAPSAASVERLADLVEGAGARRRTDSVLIAAIRSSVGAPVQPARLIAAGQQAIALTDYVLAEQLAANPAVAGTDEGLALMGRALVAQRRFDDADRVFATALAQSDGDKAADLHTLLAYLAIEVRADLEQSQLHLNAARTLAAGPPSQARAAAASVTMSFLTGWPTIALNDADRIDVSQLEPLERIRLSMVRSTALLIRAEPAAALRTCAETRAFIDAAGATGWLDEERSEFTGFVAMGLSDPDRSIELINARLAGAADLGEDASILILVGLAHVANAAGRFDVARDAAARWMRLRPTSSDRMTDGAGWGIVANVAAECADWAGARVALRERARLPFELNSAPVPYIARGRLAFDSGDDEGARAILRTGLEVALDQDLLLFGAEIANQLSLVGDERSALQGLDTIIERVGGGGAEGWVLSDWHAGVAASIAGASSELENLADSLFGRGFRVDAARNAARAALHADRPTERLRLIVKARALERSTNGGRCPLLASVPTGLSERELEFVLLAAAGRSNRDIADEHVVSQRTVENHLHRALRKLDATRSDLIDVLGGSEEVLSVPTMAVE